MNPAVVHLPPAMERAAPELTVLALPDETRSDCANCALAGSPFLKDVKCCTYHPALPNYLVGRALLRSDAGSDAIRARLQDADGVDAGGLGPPRDWVRRYEAKRHEVFGRDRAWKCPYWVPGELNCSIWRDRTAVCRTWHCRHVDHAAGHKIWTVARKLMEKLEHQLATLAMEAVPFDGDWEAYFEDTARFVATLEELPPDPKREELREELVRLVHQTLELPDVVAPLVRDVSERGDEVDIVGYSPWNPERFPRSVFALLAACDGERTWTDAVALAQQTDPAIDRSWVERLVAIDALREADPSVPWGFEADDLDPSALG